MSKKTVASCVALLCFLFSAVGYAGIPQTINYQGLLTKTNGKPLTGTVDLVFSIYDDDLAANPAANLLWLESYFAVNIQQGVLNIELGGNPIVDPMGNPILLPNGTPLPTLVSVIQSLPTGGNRWMEIMINGVPMAPLQQFSSTAFSMHSGTADDVPGKDITPNTITINGTLVIDANGEWVGPPIIAGANATSVASTSAATATIDVNKILQLEIPKAIDGVNATSVASTLMATAIVDPSGILQFEIPKAIDGVNATSIASTLAAKASVDPAGILQLGIPKAIDGVNATSISATLMATATIDANGILQFGIPKAINGVNATTLPVGSNVTAS
ncbi:MAG: hypothetical protein HQK84_03885, partial [Nitrospinae bacterium]|nr:hypothetical protein [Nitrospinota bacterium]